MGLKRLNMDSQTGSQMKNRTNPNRARKQAVAMKEWNKKKPTPEAETTKEKMPGNWDLLMEIREMVRATLAATVATSPPTTGMTVEWKGLEGLLEMAVAMRVGLVAMQQEAEAEMAVLVRQAASLALRLVQALQEAISTRDSPAES